VSPAHAPRFTSLPPGEAPLQRRLASHPRQNDAEKETEMKDVYAIYESKEGRERSRWVRVGVAFDNKDGSVNLLLDAVPLSGRLQVRPRPNANPSAAPAADPDAAEASRADAARSA
jgi:hypothetical protein